MDYSILLLCLLALVGVIAGAVNTVAGGGSNLTLPVLMMLGLPPEIANGTNRVAVTLQCVVGVRGFDRYQSLDRQAVIPILVPTTLGGLLGALMAAVMPSFYLKPLLLGSILLMSFIILVKPTIIAPPLGTPALSPTENRAAWWGLFIAGVYGGFVQAGVGFILIGALAGGLRYDLLRANALKMTCTLAFTALALVVFVLFDQVRWIPGLILAAGSMLGAHLAVKVAVRTPQSYIKWFLFGMTLVAVTASLFF
ncbi:MAG: sulfite exporter TauE/SafE family protein [Pseudohongiellaceae bacterium]